MENIEKITELSFHGVDYILRILARDEQLHLEIEQKDNGYRWKNSFTASYLEEISQKTGNFKKFPIFVKMLLTAIQKNSDSVFLDILTYQDLEMLKARKQKTNNGASQNMDKLKTNNKRYMILTYVVEFDKVHYPLPLNYEENPDLESLKNTIKRLRSEIDDLKTINSQQTQTRHTQEGAFFLTQESNNAGNGGASGDIKTELVILRSENDTLKSKIKKLEDSLANSSAKKGGGAVEYDLLLKNKLELESELENVKKDYIKDVKRLKTKLEDTEKELEEARDEIIKLKEDPEGTRHSRSLNNTETELLASKKMVAKHQREVERVVEELENFKTIDKKQKTRIRQLEIELESALKRVTYSRNSNNADKTNSPYSRSRGNSPSASSSKRSTSMPNKVFSPTNLKNYERKPTPTKKTSATKVPSRTSTGSDTESNSRGVLKQRNSNSSPLRINGMGTDPLRKVTPKRDNLRVYAAKKQSPKPRNISPSNRFNNSPGSSINNRTSPSNRGGTIGKTYMINDPSNRKPKVQLKTNNYMSDSEDEMQSSKLERSKMVTKSSYSSNANTLVANSNSQIKKLKENIQDLKDSKTSTSEKASEKEPEKDILDKSIDVTDIDQRLNRLQDLLKKVK